MKSTHPAPTPARPRGQGFSLVELLVVISILALLIGILVPALSNIRESSKRAASRSLLGTLEFGLKQYSAELNGALPPSSSSSYGGGSWYGSELLLQGLTGYAPARQANGDWFDRADGEGFRLIDRGQVYGPYVDSGRLTLSVPDGQSRPVILDSFGNVVLYYRFDAQAGGYDDGDNREGPPRIDPYVQGLTGEFPRADYVLITPGTDGEWTTDWSANDDVTNFTE